MKQAINLRSSAHAAIINKHQDPKNPSAPFSNEFELA